MQQEVRRCTLERVHLNLPRAISARASPDEDARCFSPKVRSLQSFGWDSRHVFSQCASREVARACPERSEGSATFQVDCANHRKSSHGGTLVKFESKDARD